MSMAFAEYASDFQDKFFERAGDDNHLETGLRDSEEATRRDPWVTWAEKVEKILGHSLDGTDWIEGYSLDSARDDYQNGYEPEECARYVKARKADIENGLFWHKFSQQHFTSHDEDGFEQRHDELVYYVGKMTDDELEKRLEDFYPEERCQHEYDCCAKWYQNQASFKRKGEIAVITLSYTQNI